MATNNGKKPGVQCFTLSNRNEHARGSDGGGDQHIDPEVSRKSLLIGDQVCG